MEHANNANSKLLHECEILRNRLQECSVNFLSEEEDKLDLDTSSPSDAIDLLTTSDNRIGLLLAEVTFRALNKLSPYFHINGIYLLSVRNSFAVASDVN